MPETTKALLDEVHLLNDHVMDLSRRLTVGGKALRRLRAVTYTCVVLVIMCILTTAALIVISYKLADAQVVACENRNEQAKGHRNLWTYVIEVSKTNNPDSSYTREHYYEEMQQYINELYAARDCSNLDKNYPVPEPPQPPRAK